MRIRALGGLLCLLIAAGGCATTPLPGGAGDVRGALQRIEFYAGWPERGAGYSTEGREQFFASDKELGVGLLWGFPEPGEYTVKAVLRTPAGAVHGQRESRTGAKTANWLTGRRFPLPQGEEAGGWPESGRSKCSWTAPPWGSGASASTPPVSVSGPKRGSPS